MYKSLAVVCAFTACVVPGVYAYDNNAPFSRTPPLGWSSWVALGPGAEHPIFDFCDEAGVKAAADAFMESGLYEHGYRHFHLDDCWAGGRNASGYLYGELDHFPNGMKSVVDYVHSKGLAFGLYTCGGTYTCVGKRPGSRDHWVQDAEVFAEWGVDWVKMDWCNSQGEDPVQTYPLMSKAMNQTGRAMHFNMCEWGDADPWKWGPDIAQSWRMSRDHTGTWDSTMKQIRSTMAIPAIYSGKAYGWNDMDMLETGNYAQAAHANGKEGTMTAIEYKTEFSIWAIAASPLVVTTPIMNCSSPPPPPGFRCNVTLVKKSSIASCTAGASFGCYDDNASMWTDNGCRGTFDCNGQNTSCDVDGLGRHVCACASGGPVTCKAALTDLQKEILFNDDIIAINQDVTPQGRPIVTGNSTVWARFLSDDSVAVAFYNENNFTANIRLDFSALAQMVPLPVPSAASWSATTTATVRDLWAHTDGTAVTGGYPEGDATVAVQPHETKMFRFTKTN
eukprot:m.678461 g.678461  ORF g.678461 m.678461 type:complete len:505 (-) comp22804_c2_seq15:2838-4352(-)